MTPRAAHDSIRAPMPTETTFNPHLLGLDCPACGATTDLSEPRSTCPACAKPLLAHYDLAAIGREVKPETLGRFGSDLWRYRSVLPFAPEFAAVRLGEGGTPLLPMPRLGATLGVRELWLKEE